MSKSGDDTEVIRRAVIRELVKLAKRTALVDGRDEPRYPFFRPAWIELDSHSYSGFTRDISPNGLGLLHYAILPLRKVLVKFTECPEGIVMNISRCEPIGEGWFISGGSIVG